MSQSALDGGSGGWNTFLSGVVQTAGNTLANKINGGSETTADQTLTEDISGAPTPVQTSSAGNISAALSDAKTLVMIGGFVLGGVTLYLIASR